MSDKMREEFEEECHAEEALRSLAVMGSPVAWTSAEWLKEDGKLHGMTRRHPSFKVPLYRAPTTSITQAELERLRKDAERYRWLRSSSVGPHELFQACLIDLGCGLQTMKSELDLDEAIDAAIAAEGEKE